MIFSEGVQDFGIMFAPRFGVILRDLMEDFVFINPDLIYPLLQENHVVRFRNILKIISFTLQKCVPIMGLNHVFST